jgi:hypothetical protein
MKKTEIDSTLCALQAYVKLSPTCRRLLKRELCHNNDCISEIVHDLLETDQARMEYDTLFSLVAPRDICTVITDSSTLSELKESVEYHIHGIELLKQVSDSKVDYMIKLFYKLSSIVWPYYTARDKRIARSPPPPRKRKQK